MKEVLLIIILTVMLIVGFFIMRRIDKFLSKNTKKIEKPSIFKDEKTNTDSKDENDKSSKT